MIDVVHAGRAQFLEQRLPQVRLDRHDSKAPAASELFVEFRDLRLLGS